MLWTINSCWRFEVIISLGDLLFFINSKPRGVFILCLGMDIRGNYLSLSCEVIQKSELGATYVYELAAHTCTHSGIIYHYTLTACHTQSHMEECTSGHLCFRWFKSLSITYSFPARKTVCVSIHSINIKLYKTIRQTLMESCSGV